MMDRSTVGRVLADNLYVVLGTANEDGQPCFDSTVAVGQAEAAYFDAHAAQATPHHSYLLIRGGDPEHGNAVDTTVEV